VALPEDPVKEWRLDDPLPTPFEQIASLVLWVGDYQGTPIDWVSTTLLALGARLGTACLPQHDGLLWLLNLKQVSDLIETMGEIPLKSCAELRFRLTLSGWERYAALKAARAETRTAFMAMKFDDTEMNECVAKCFKPAVSRAGFVLSDLMEGQQAGLIDDQLRNALRIARFVIADLTHGSHGAYWEAGFAEGLGRPVIYTCRKAEWEERKTHFDTDHLVTVPWSSENFGEAGRKLTATIRATLPAEAKLDDP
jgi:hypothetical protein